MHIMNVMRNSEILTFRLFANYTDLLAWLIRAATYQWISWRHPLHTLCHISDSSWHALLLFVHDEAQFFRLCLGFHIISLVAAQQWQTSSFLCSRIHYKILCDKFYLLPFLFYYCSLLKGLSKRKRWEHIFSHQPWLSAADDWCCCALITAVFSCLRNLSKNILDVVSVWKCKIRTLKAFSVALIPQYHVPISQSSRWTARNLWG